MNIDNEIKNNKNICNHGNILLDDKIYKVRQELTEWTTYTVKPNHITEARL